MYSFYRDSEYSYKWLRDVRQAQQVSREHQQSQYPNAIAWSNLWIIIRLKNTNPNATKPQDKQIQQHNNNLLNSSSSSSSSISSEWKYVNLKVRACDPTAEHGVLLKQWRRSLHNIAAQDLAVKPDNQIEITHNIQTGQPYPAQQWLIEMNEIFHSYNWKLPEWANQYGELQLRCKLKDRYAIIARVPWSNKQQQIEHKKAQ